MDIYTEEFHATLKRHGVDFATGVPCGVQKSIIYKLSHDPQICHIPATRESEAIGIAAGAYLAGKTSMVYMQNSGLFNCSNDIASLLIPYKIPILLSVSWRGCEGEDAPQHSITGKATPTLLESLGIPYYILEKNNIGNILASSFKTMEEREIPAAMLIRRGWSR